MRTCLRSLLFFVAAIPAVSAALAAGPVDVVMGTATPGGGFPVYGDAVVRTIAKTDPELHVEARNTRGSTENIPLLEAGKLDIALVQGEAAHEALQGVGRPPAKLAIIAAMYSTPGMFVVRADSPYRSIRDLRGKPVAFGARGSGLVILARYVLDGLGLDMDKDFQAVYLERAGDGPAMVADGRVAALWGGGSSWPGFTAVANGAHGGRFIVPDDKEIAAITARHGFLKVLTLPANSFKGQPEALASVGSWSVIMARPGLPAETAYRLTRALHLGEKMIADLLPQARETTAKNTAAVAPEARLHPGTLKYLKEIGEISKK
ncbi:TAXI family TRAP transporter solute-binding subunit [Noviherbaspirillum galbum]|uniref:TAXI family TRAP transporter solute-binding subunit n=1 Tax=Noviherbaspirillum galbum TaxID=2709383 RepID=UPI001969EB8D|nr:TAXI family TRAP transporter solute-binding subunit [Noviherbaspirillum galbum]